MLQSILFKSGKLQLTAGVGTHDVAVHLRLSVLKAKHANWIVEIYNIFHSDNGVTVIKSGFRKADITEAIEMVEFPTFQSKTHFDLFN